MKKLFSVIALLLVSLSSFAWGPGGGTLSCEMPYYESRHSNGLNIASNHGVNITNDTNKSYTYSIQYTSWFDQGNGPRPIAQKLFDKVIDPGQTFSDKQQISAHFRTHDKGHFKIFAITNVQVHGKNIMPGCRYENKFRSY
jgi:hypothetical protein